MQRALRAGAVATATIASTIGLPGVGPADAATTIVVRPGQSIQAAVDRAHAGDTVLIKPGTYRQEVLVSTDGVQIRGSGGGKAGTVLMPPAKQTFGAGIAVTDLANPKHRVRNVHVNSLLTTGGWKFSGVVGGHTKNLFIENVRSVSNRGYGVATFDGVNSTVLGNQLMDNGDAGIYVGDEQTSAKRVAGNVSTHNGMGIFLRHSRHSQVTFNLFADNCTGIFSLNDGQAGGAGSNLIAANTIRHNNRVCPPHGNETIPSGAGILLLGSTNNVILHNAVLNNQGTGPLSGGIVLVAAGPSAPSTGNAIVDNTAFKNRPGDIVATRKGNTIRHNFCHVSVPAGSCHN